MQNVTIRTAVKMAYEFQAERITTGNRIAAMLADRMEKPEGLDDDSLKAKHFPVVLDKARAEAEIAHARKIEKPRAAFVPMDVLHSELEYMQIIAYESLASVESAMFKAVEREVKKHPLWDAFFADAKGCGPTMAAVCLAEIDIHRAQYPSSLWRYAGLDVGGDGRGRSRRAEHLVEVDYTDSDGNAAKRKGITFNPFLKTKLVGVLGSSFLKSGGKYREIYDDNKHRLESHAKYAEVSKGHRHNMAIRYAVKRFLVDLYVAWRTLEGLPVATEYSEAKLGKVHRVAA